MNKPGKTAINNLKRLASFWSPIYILIAVTLLSVTACDSTYQYKELRIVSVDKLGTMDENKEVPEEAMDKLLKIDGQNEFTIYLASVGKKQKV